MDKPEHFDVLDRLGLENGNKLRELGKSLFSKAFSHSLVFFLLFRIIKKNIWLTGVSESMNDAYQISK